MYLRQTAHLTRNLFLSCLALLANFAYAVSTEALPGEVERGASIVEALGRGKYLMVFGSLCVAYLGWRVYSGKSDLGSIMGMVIGIILIFFAFPIGMALYSMIG